MLAAAEADGAAEGSEFDRASWGVGYMEEGLVGLAMEIHILLDSATMGAMIGEVALFCVEVSGFVEVGPGLELLDRVLVHSPDVGDGELGQGFIFGSAAHAVDADQGPVKRLLNEGGQSEVVRPRKQTHRGGSSGSTAAGSRLAKSIHRRVVGRYVPRNLDAAGADPGGNDYSP